MTIEDKVEWIERTVELLMLAERERDEWKAKAARLLAAQRKQFLLELDRQREREIDDVRRAHAADVLAFKLAIADAVVHFCGGSIYLMQIVGNVVRAALGRTGWISEIAPA